MEMRIESLKLTNFKGVKSFALQAERRSVSVVGDNAAGKTTLVDAWLWLLFGCDSRGRTAFEIKALNELGESVHGLNHEVEASIVIVSRDPKCPDHGGSYEGDHCTCSETTLVLKKLYKEKWSKKRGSASKEFTGHTTDHFIDGVPVKKNEFEDRVAALCDKDALQLLTDPTYFSEQIHWQDRRKILLTICGDISDEDVVASDKSLSDLSEILGNRTIANHRKVILARRSEINAELQRVPVRIDEVARSIIELVEDEDKAGRALSNDREELDRIVQEKTRLTSGGEVAELNVRIAELKTALESLHMQSRIGHEKKVGPLRRKIADKEEAVRERLRERRMADAELQDRVIQLAETHKNVASHGEWRDEVNALSFEYDGHEACPTCGRKLTQKQFDEAKKVATAVFNTDKAKRLKDVDDTLGRLGGSMKAAEQEVAEAKQKVEGASETAVEGARQELAEAEKAFSDLGVEPDTSSDPEAVKLEAEKEAILSRVTLIKQGDIAALAEVDGRLAAAQEGIAKLETVIARFGQVREAKDRKQELEKQERRLASEYEDLERQLYLTEEFTKTKVSLLETRINSQFEQARFKMFKILVNGGIEECCEVLCGGVPYTSNLNHGAQIQVGLDIVRTLQRFHDFSPPVWVDQSESITELPEIECQMIRLVVKKGVKKLKIEAF